MLTRLTIIHALSPLHAGTGQAAGAIDLPIARERPTGIPLLPGSSIKGALRSRVTDREWQHAIFGPDTANASEHAGAVHFADAHLLLLPVRSLWGTFAWVTSPYLLGRFARDLREAGGLLKLPKSPDLDGCLVARRSVLRGEPSTSKVVLEDLDFKTHDDLPVDLLADIAESLGINLAERLCVVHDDVMSTLLETATEVRARIRLKEATKTVEGGALWYEESLPTESVLFGLVLASDTPQRDSTPLRSAHELLNHLAGVAANNLQLGGKATIGRGVCALRFVAGGNK